MIDGTSKLDAHSTHGRILRQGNELPKGSTRAICSIVHRCGPPNNVEAAPRRPFSRINAVVSSQGQYGVLLR